MSKMRCALALFIIALAGCGPDTIFVRPGLDTPVQHVRNGQQLLQRGKLQDAFREFNRALELDPNYINAHIGLGITLGRKGDIDAGLAAMAQADRLADNKKEHDAVKDGYRQLREMESGKKDVPAPP